MELVPVLAQLLNFAISLVFWATLGRVMLRLMLGGEPRNFFLGVLQRATDPAYAVVGRVLPRAWVPVAVLVLTAPLIGPLRLLLLPLLRA